MDLEQESDQGETRQEIENQEQGNTSSTEKEADEANKLELPEGIIIPPPPQCFGVGEPGEPRLIITHIVNVNFKSYAGRQVLGPFHKSFTGIIGPNGSGKSNVIDSMLFVFGYRANKIRSKKLSVLIHNSENHKNFTSCTVEVHFEKIVDLENGGYCSVPESGFRVSRRASVDNSSQYFINNRKVQFREIASFLQNNGIDLHHNRFLILQGEVEQISLMKPKALNEHGDGMLEYLEDIIGSSRYKESIEKLSKEIEDLDEERKDKLSRVKLVEKDKEQLEPLRNEAILFLKKENEIASLNNKLLQIYIRDLTHEAETFKKRLTEFDEQKKEMEEELSKHREDKKKITRECLQLAKSLEDASANHLKSKEEMRKLEKTNVTVFEDRKHRKTKLKELIKKLEKEKKKMKDLEDKPSRLTEEIEDLTEDRSQLVIKKKEAEERKSKVMEMLLQDTKELQVEKEKLEKILLEKMKIVNEKKQRWEVAHEEMELFISNLKNAENELDQSKKKISDLDEKEKESSRELKVLRGNIPKMEGTLLKNKSKMEDLSRKEQRLESESKESQALLSDATHSSNSSKAKGAVVKFLIQLKKSGKIPGIHGRLGDLGGIDEKYDVAISSCCGALENIVVDNIETAQKCVQALKKNSVGQATFIALDKMSRHAESARPNPRTPLPRLIDLVTPREEIFRVAFYHALRDTLVADEINSASKVAYSKSRRWRVVTLKGEVIDTSGTMSGGGNRVMRGRMGSTSVQDEIDPIEIEKMKKKNQKINEELEKIREEISSLDEEIVKLENDLQTGKSKVKSLEHAISSQRSVKEGLQRGIPALEKALNDAQPDPNQLSKLKKNVARLKNDYDVVANDAEEIEKQKDSIHFEISETNSRRMKPCDEALNDVTNKIDETTKKLTKLKVAITTAKRNQEKCQISLVAIEGEIEENTNCVKELEKQWKELEVTGARVLEDLAECEAEEKKISQDLRSKQSELKKMDDIEGGLGEKMKKYKESTEMISSQFNSKLEQVNIHKESLSKLKLHKIDDVDDGEDQDKLRILTPDELEGSKETLKNEINILSQRISNIQPNMNAIQEYKEKQKVYLQRVGDLDKVTAKRDEYRGIHDQLRKNRLNEFSDGFMVITNKLKEIYQMITLGGDAELEFVDSLDPFSEGIVFSVRPPKKSWKNICNLSGGEKTLSSLALVFALHHYRPTPLYVMDEIDAALDFKNVSIIAQYIIERTKNAQFIIITLRNNMFEAADRLVGIYKTDNCTKSCLLEPALVTANMTRATAS